jgi:hypothetical protein
MPTNLNDFKQTIDCFYKNEKYSARDNGAVLRHTPNAKQARPTDNKWTFGKLNNNSGYLEIASVPIHRIITVAFNGDPPTKEHVVDHIDTNKQNNRPDNLRWVTRLENILLNPITVKRIETVCGCSVEEFLAEPSKYRHKFQNTKIEWMCTVSAQEAQVCKERLLAWAKSDKFPSGGSLGEWIYNRGLPKNHFEETPEFTTSLTPNTVQKNWKTPSEFPCCPQDISNKSITDYFANLKVEKVFSQNQYLISIIYDFAISKDENTIWVMCENSGDNAIKPYSLAEVTLENNVFVHNSLGSFFEKDGAEKQFTLSQGLESTRGETFDESC